MVGKKGEKIRIVLVIALSVVFMISLYFRFIHAKVKATEAGRSHKSSPGLLNQPVADQGNVNRNIPNRLEGMGIEPLPANSELAIPRINSSLLQETPDIEPTVNDDLKTVIRDIFMPLEDRSRPLKETEDPQPEPESSIPRPLPSFKLRGTIVGKKGSIAIINDQFLRQGDWIGEFQVAEIGKKDVLLDSGDQKIILEILNNE